MLSVVSSSLSEHLNLYIYPHQSAWRPYYISIPYLGFFCFILSLKALCNPSLEPWSCRAQRRLASDGKESVHLSVRHCYRVGALSYVNFSGQVTFLLTSGGKPKQAHFPLHYVPLAITLTPRGKFGVRTVAETLPIVLKIWEMSVPLW